MATIEEAFDVVSKTFRISALNAPHGEERCVTILKTAARQPRPQGAFPWLRRWGGPPPKPGKSALGTRLAARETRVNCAGCVEFSNLK